VPFCRAASADESAVNQAVASGSEVEDWVVSRVARHASAQIPAPSAHKTQEWSGWPAHQHAEETAFGLDKVRKWKTHSQERMREEKARSQEKRESSQLDAQVWLPVWREASLAVLVCV
jgi:hypothetical protein